MWEEEEDNLKISSTPDLALSHGEAAAMALAAGVLQNPALFYCSTCAGLSTLQKRCSIFISKQET